MSDIYLVGQRRWSANLLTAAAWLVGLAFFFPVLWMLLNSFKTEADANTSPKLFFEPTTEQYATVTTQSEGLLGFQEAFVNSLVIVGVSTLLVLALAVPAAYALSIRPVQKWRDVWGEIHVK